MQSAATSKVVKALLRTVKRRYIKYYAFASFYISVQNLTDFLCPLIKSCVILHNNRQTSWSITLMMVVVGYGMRHATGADLAS